MKTLIEINKKIEDCNISEIKSLSNEKRKLIYDMYEKIMIKEQFPLSSLEQIQTLKYKVEQICTLIKEQAYFDIEHLKHLEIEKTDIETKLFTLELGQNG